ncbi:bifunctional glycosyltransferase family 2/GtrA family protein [uncultured Schumannella sp.]|uniref:bifunctional glycosyltransferase family 2/GtrA family protein n=1 Tax=uncultured Schumannella sp. TaxID=1195956 RepID=UPI0025ED09C3|nr:bifunctional glycosyltransferase family 2/GtrA family protein [uncultured Schumannella sp.]
MIVLIPALEPDARLTELVRELGTTAPDVRVVVVDDGSGPAYTAVFESVLDLGAELLAFPQNRGKGVTLKAGLRHVLAFHRGHDVVTADSDGQHTVEDILRVAFRLRAESDALVLGARDFHGEVPARSRFGNAVSAAAFKVAAGYAVTDTQTGLRGLPASALEWLARVPGDRFEYELEVLLGAREAGVRVVEEPIATIYLEHNASSHFRPIRDSARVLRPVLRFGASSLVAFAIDTALLALVFWLSDSLIAAVIVARLVSGTVNFALNRRAFSAHQVPLRHAVPRYVALALVLLAANYVWLATLVGAGLPLLVSKIITEVSLYIVSFAVQRSIVFARRGSAPYDNGAPIVAAALISPRRAT